jgi:cyclic pyranopterin phosphate synthase
LGFHHQFSDFGGLRFATATQEQKAGDDMDSFTHFNEKGEARMVDVSAKGETWREAIASCQVFLNEGTFALVKEGALSKGDALGVARIAGIMGAKKTSELIPLCHPVALSSLEVDFSLDSGSLSVIVTAAAKCSGSTGVEMEALTAAAVAALAIYDMCKAAQKDIVISNMRLIKKTGGKSGEYMA